MNILTKPPDWIALPAQERKSWQRTRVAFGAQMDEFVKQSLIASAAANLNADEAYESAMADFNSGAGVLDYRNEPWVEVRFIMRLLSALKEYKGETV